jgi:cytidylate kinase
MVRAGAVSDEIRMKRMEKHPQRLAEVAAARAAQAEAIQRVRQREQKLIAQFKELYGIDPTASSFFSYEDDFSSESSETF